MSNLTNNRKELKGVFPLVPFAIKEDQSPDYDALAENVDFLANSGVHGTVMFGCMGEFYAPSDEEFRKCVDVAVDAAAGRIAVVVGATWINTHGCISRIKYCEKAGADGVMVATPFAINPNQEVALEHFRMINDAVHEIQIMVYNYPLLTRGFNITSELWDHLLELEHITAVKDSQNDVWHRDMIAKKISDKINIFSGGEGFMFSDYLMGGNGVVSIWGIAMPKAVMAFHQALLERNIEKALPYAQIFSSMTSHITAENEVAALKAVAIIGGKKAGRPRSPYQPLDTGTFAILERLMKELASL